MEHRDLATHDQVTWWFRRALGAEAKAKEFEQEGCPRLGQQAREDADECLNEAVLAEARRKPGPMRMVNPFRLDDPDAVDYYA